MYIAVAVVINITQESFRVHVVRRVTFVYAKRFKEDSVRIIYLYSPSFVLIEYFQANIKYLLYIVPV
jgi:hypothetical protein